MASGLSNIGKKLKTTDPKEDQKEEYSSGLAKIGYRFKEKNLGGGLEGVTGGTAYTLGRIGVGLVAPIEGITDVVVAAGDLIAGNPQQAKERFTNSYTGEWQEGLDRWYNPGKGMQVVGDITGGVGQSVAYGLISMIPYAGVPLMYTSIGSQGVSSAAQKTGNLGWRELGYGATVGAVEGLLESKLGAGVQGAKKLGSAILKKTGKNVTKSGVKAAAKTAGKGMAKTVLTDAAKGFAGEFAEEAISEWADPLVQRTWGIDKEARADFGSILYAGVIGGVSGGLVSAGPSAINYRRAVKTGRAIQEKGLDGELINRARRTLAGFEITKERAEAMKVEKPSGDEKETAEQKKARNKANKESKKISKQTAMLADKIEKNIKAYEQLRADPAKANKDMTAAVLGELRGNLFLLPIAYQVDTVEAVLREASDADRQAFVDVINEQMRADGKESNYTLADFDADKDQIRRRLAGELELEELYERMGMQTSEEATETAKEAATDPWEGMAYNEDMSGYKAAGEAENALLKAAVNQGVPRGSVQAMLDEYRKGTDMTPAEFAEAWSDGVHKIGRFDLTVKDGEDEPFNRLPESAREASRRIGRETAEAETKAREEAAKAKKKPAEQAGKKGEVVRGEGLNVQKLSDEQYSAYKAAEVLAEALGTDIVLETSIERNGKTVNGYYSRKTNRFHININAMRNGKNIAVYTLGHEVTHYIKEWSPAKFKVLQDFVIKQMGVDAETAIAEKMASLKRLGIITDTMTVAEANDVAVEEVVADGMELVLTDGKVLEELAHTDKSLWNKVKSWISNIISKIRKHYESLNQASKTAQVLKETVESLDEIERLFTEGAKEAGERARTAEIGEVAQGEGEVIYSFAGEHAKVADYKTFAEARQMIYDGEDTETVRQKTGWFQGYDGKWRFEIDDSQMEVDITGRFSNDPEIPEYLDLMNKVYFEGTGTDADEKRLRELDLKYKDKSIVPNTLGEIIRHERLFEAYPQLKDVAVVFVDSTEENGSYHSGTKEITLSKRLKMNKKKLKKTLGHEIQHAIQDIERFAGGSSPKQWAEQIAKVEDGDGRTPYQLYESTAGEIEARDVASRADMTEEQRKNTRPDIDREDVVFADDESISYYIVELDNGKQYVQATEGQVISGNDPTMWAQQVTNYINRTIRGGQDFVIKTEQGDFLTITRDTAYKAGTRNQVKNPDGTYRTMTDAEYRVKLNAEVHINELAQIAKKNNKPRVPDRKNHKFAKDGFTYRVAYFRDFDGKYYRLTISVGHNGEVSTVYNVGQMKTDMLPSGKIVSTFKGSKANSMSVDNTIPQKPDSVNTSAENSSENSSDNLYSIDETAENADVSENERLKAENKKLEERVQRMRYRQFRKAVESGEMEAKAHKQELSDGATTVLESIGIGDGRNHTELTRRMSELYARMAGEKKISYGEAFDEAAKISDWLLGIQHDIRDVEASERAKEILKTLRGTKIRLTFTQKGEVANLMGNSDAYRKAMLGKVTVTNNDGVPLDVQWAEWSDLYPDVFSKEVDEADMPDRLRRIYDMLTMQRDRTESVDQYINRDELTNTIFTQVGQIGWNEIQTEEARPDLSDRDMLLAIAEQMVGSEDEYKIISDYKKKYDGIRRKEKRIQELNDRQRELQSILFTSENAKARSDASKELRDIYEETGSLLEEVAEADKKLANIEGMKVIRNLIKVERMEARETYKTEYKKMQKESAERKEITIRKRQAQRILGLLNTMLYHPTKAKHVPPLMQSLVDYALKRADPKQFGINRDNIRTMSELAADIEKMKSKATLTADEQEQLYKMEAKYEALEADTLSVKRQAEALMTAFETWVEQTSDAEVVDENMLQGLRDTVKEIDEAPLHLMTLKSLEAVESLYAAIKYQVDHSNNLFATNEKLGKQEMGQEATAEVAKQKESKLFTPKPGEWTKIARVREFIWENLKPLTAFEVIGSDKLMSLFRNILNGEDVWVKDVLEGKKVLDDAKKKYGYNKWDLTARKEVTTADGSTVSLTLGERMSLYAYMFREQAEEHLSTGGFVLAPDAKTIGTLKGIKAYEAYLNDQSAYQMRKEDIAKMAEGLTQDQKDYARAVQKYLTTLGKKGNEVSLKLYGMEIFNETDYFPIKSSRDYLKAQAGKTGDPQIKNRGTFKETTPGANNPIVLEDFMQVTSEHINTMAVYHAFTLPMEDLLRVWNYKPVNYKTDENGNVLLNDNGLPIADNEKEVQYNSLKAEIAKKYGKKANDYILQLMRDLNGGARQDSATTILDKGLTAFKRSATMLSLSTIIQQPTSIFRAMAYIPAKYFKGAKFYDYETVKKYAPVAAIKQIGGHDTSTGARTVEYINSKEYENQKEKLAAAAKRKVAGGDPQARADYFGFLTEKADEVAWRYMFGACVNEQAAKLKKPASSEEVLKAAGERFADVVRRTQVYDSTLTRSEIMRSKSSAAKLVTAFGAEPATVVSMLVDGIVKAERGDKSFFRKTAGAVAISIIINAMASSLIYAMRDDDEDENFLEKYVQALTGEIIEGFTLFEYLPYARDVMSLFKGYDVERSDMTLIGNLFDQVEMITSSKRSFADKLFGVSGAVSAFFGVPITNVYRDAKGIIKTAASFGDAEPMTGSGTGLAVVEGVKSQYNLIFKLFGAQEGNAFELYKAALRGDTAHYERVAARYETEKDAEMALRKELRENDRRIAEAAQAKIDGDLEVFESIIEQIEGEGHFDRNIIIRAINNEVLSIQDASKQATATKDDTVTDEEDEEIAEALYTYTDLADAIDREDADDFKAVYDYLLSFKMEQGKTEAQAKSAVKSAVTSRYRKRYLEAWAKNNTIEMRRILALLVKTGFYGNHNDTAKTVEKWVRDANK